MDIKIFADRDIRLPRVRVIDSSGTNLGVLETRVAQDMARNAGLNLVQVNPPDKDKIPTCKIMDLGKYKFELSKKKKKEEKKQRESAIKVKELLFRFTTDTNDLRIKANQAQEFLNDGHTVRVKFELMSKNKTTAKRRMYSGNNEKAVETIDKFMEMLPGCSAKIESKEEKRIIFIIVKK